MRRTTALLIAIVAGAVLLGSAERADAQGRTVYDYDDYRAWWDSFNCDEMKTLLIAKTGESSTAHEARVCGMSDSLTPADLLILQTFIESTMHEGYASHEAWWNANTDAGRRQALAGRVAISAADQTSKAPSSDSAERDYSEDYDRLRSGTVMDRVVKSAAALSGQSAMMTDEEEEEEAPALPLAGIAILGALLAGRGWWLRRRQ